MVTRLYLSSTVASDVNPPFDLGGGTWNEVDNADRRKCNTVKSSSAMTDKAEVVANGAGIRQLVRQYVSPPLSGAQSISGTVKGTIRVRESAANDNLDRVSLAIYVVSNDGQTLRGDCLVVGDYFTSAEFATALTARRIADGDTITSVSALDGDRIVIELGFNHTASGTSITGTENFGDNSATDLGDNETDTVANNPFVEFSGTFTFATVAKVQSTAAEVDLSYVSAVQSTAAEVDLSYVAVVQSTAAEVDLDYVAEPTFTEYGKVFLFTAANWAGTVQFFFEAFMKATVGTAYARLFNVTAGAEVSGSRISTTATTNTRVRSGALTLVDTNVYRCEFGKLAADSGTFRSGRIIGI